MPAVARRAETVPIWLALALAACGEAKPLGRSAATPDGRTCATGALASSDARGDKLGGHVAGPTSPGSSDPATAPCPPASREEGAGATGEPCPKGMKLVDTDYCTNMQRTCIEEEYSPQNKITICHRFATKQKCVGREEHRRFC